MSEVKKTCQDCFHYLEPGLTPGGRKWPACELSGTRVSPLQAGCQYWNVEVEDELARQAEAAKG